MAKQTKKALGKAHQADRELAQRAAEVKDHPVTQAAHAVAQLSDQPPLFALATATIAGGLLLRRPQLARTGVRMFAAHAIGTGVKWALKRTIDRTRPHAERRGKRYQLKPGHSDQHDLSSFPSGHTTGAVAIARAVTRDSPGAAPIAGTVAGAIAAVQLPAAKHYASDVIAGAAIGWLAEAIASAVMDRLMPAPPSADPPGPSAPR